MTDHDEHGQPNIGINYHANAAKALNELIGICRGIAANDVVTVDELVYLSAWLSEHAHLRKDGDYLDLMELTSEIASTDDVDLCDLEELLDVVQCVLEFRSDANTPFDNADIAIGRLIGLCRGMGGFTPSKLTVTRLICAPAQSLTKSHATGWPI